MKRTCLSLLITCCLAVGTQANAQALPPPVERAPAGLPPLPGGTSTPPVSLPNTPATGLPPAPGNVAGQSLPTVDLTQTNRPQFVLDEFMAGMRAELVRLDQAIGSQLRVVAVEYGSADHDRAMGVARQEKIGGLDPFVQREVTPSAILATGQFNGVGGPYSQVCVVVLDPEKASIAWESYVLPPVQAGSHPQTGYAWMAAHAVGHCLDAQSRNNAFRSKLAWRMNEATSLGLWPQAISSAFPSMGGTFAKDGFMNASERVYSHPAQRQFSERVADIFATLWIIRLGASPEGLLALSKARFENTGDDAGIAAVRRGRMYDRAKQSQRADRLWDMARDVQREIGVDSALISTSSGLADSSGIPGGEEQVAQWIVTPQGVMGVDARGNLIQKPNTTQQVGGGKNFKDLKRFGQ